MSGKGCDTFGYVEHLVYGDGPYTAEILEEMRLRREAYEDISDTESDFGFDDNTENEHQGAAPVTTAN